MSETPVKITNKDMDEFWDALRPYAWKYNGRKDEGEYLGFMIQDIEHTKVGASICFEGGDGVKRYNFQKLLGVLVVEAKRNYEFRKKCLESENK